MFWLLSIYNLLYLKEKYVWARVRILHETEKAKNSIFEIYVYVKESTIG